jgi:hypothetical protein
MASILTEDLGKVFEKAICLLYNIEYVGNYKYSVEDAEKIKSRIQPFKTLFPYEIVHTAKGGKPYDFTGKVDTEIKLSAKTSKNKTGKVCPQIIGQTTAKKFCEYLSIENTGDLENIKKYIVENVFHLLNIYMTTTFDCPILYYNKQTNTVLFIKLKSTITWTNHIVEFIHILKNKLWNESTTIKINNKTIGEFQIHKHRDCIKFRWAIENLIDLFADHFDIVSI